jgi:hypothetical protein
MTALVGSNLVASNVMIAPVGLGVMTALVGLSLAGSNVMTALVGLSLVGSNVMIVPAVTEMRQTNQQHLNNLAAVLLPAALTGLLGPSRPRILSDLAVNPVVATAH